MDSGQAARIRLDAFPDTSFSGSVDDVAVLAKNKEQDSKVKVFDVIVRLTEKDSTLMPGMTVSCEILVDRIADTLFIPLEALFKKNDESIVYVKKGTHFVSTPVTIGRENDDYVLISEGLKGGEEVALIDPTLLASKSEKKEENE